MAGERDRQLRALTTGLLVTLLVLGRAHPEEEGWGKRWNNAISEYSEDPTLGGRLHFTYWAMYEAKFFDYRDYKFNFADVTPDDNQSAEELGSNHRRRDTDQDLEQYLAIRTSDLFISPEDNEYVQGLDTEFSMRYSTDLDGGPGWDESVDTFNYLDDGDLLQMRTLNARVKLLDKHLEVTAGRMFVESAEWVLLDGGLATGRGLAFLGLPFEVNAFGGERVSFYSTVPRDTVWGGSLRLWPWRDGMLEVEDTYFYANSLRLGYEQNFGDSFGSNVVYRQIDDDPESLRVDLTADLPGSRLSVWAEYFGKFSLGDSDFIYDYTTPVGATGRQDEAIRYLNLTRLQPFDEGTLELRWAPTERLDLFVGGTAHLIRGGERDQFNTNWYEIWGGFDTSHIPWEGLTSRTALRYVRTDLPRRRPAVADPFLVRDVVGDGEPDFLALEFLLEQDLARKVAVGTTLEVRWYDYESRFAQVADLYGLGFTTYGRWRQNRFLSYYVIYAYDRDLLLINPDFDHVQAVRVEARFSF